MFRFLKNLVTVMKNISMRTNVSIPKSDAFTRSQLKEFTHPFPVQRCWSCHISKALGLGYDTKGTNILVTDHNKHLHVLSFDGQHTRTLSLPAKCVSIETGWHSTYGTMLFGNADYKMCVMDCEGRMLWRYPKWLGVLGINEAHCADIDGDGNDEVLLGLNGRGGLLAFTGKGKPLWKIKNIRNVWSHTIIPPFSGRKASVLATEASGHILMYNHQGQFLQTLGAKEQYFTELTAAIVNSSDCVQIAARVLREKGSCEVVVFDLEGHVIWKTPTAHSVMKRVFACEDMNGDGVREWVFIEKPGELVFVSPQGKKLATLSEQKDIEDFIIVPQSDGYGMLVTLQAGTISGYQFEK